MILTRLKVGFKWEKDGNCSTYSFGSISGAKAWVEEKRADIDWYAIEQVQYIPCDESNPGGQLYQGMLYHEFVDFKEVQ